MGGGEVGPDSNKLSGLRTEQSKMISLLNWGLFIGRYLARAAYKKV